MKKIILTILAILTTIGGIFYVSNKENVNDLTLGFAPQYGVNDGLLAYWSLDTRHTNWSSDTEGTVVDMSGNGNTGTLISMNKSTSPVIAPLGQGLDFDGTADYISIPNTSALKPSLPVTISAWVKIDTLGVTKMIFENDFIENRYYGVLLLFQATNNNFGLQYGDGDAPAASARRSFNVTDGSIVADRWYHVVGIIRGSTNMSVYVDGVNRTGAYSGTGSALTYSTGPTVIGLGDTSGSSGNNLFLDGKVGEVRFYDRELTVGEIQTLYRLGLTEGFR